MRDYLLPDYLLPDYLLPDYLILYLHRPEDIVLLSIRHHRQISFDYPFE
ncbi:hypothetical protein [Burkholderia alba]|nr:hypothetical protein [Burkholderia alba]